MQFEYSEALVEQVSNFLQQYMKNHSLEFMVPDECAELLAKHRILPNNIGPKPGFNFREMLREGRKEKIPKVTGASQEEPNKRWYIHRIGD